MFFKHIQVKLVFSLGTRNTTNKGKYVKKIGVDYNFADADLRLYNFDSLADDPVKNWILGVSLIRV